uniref:Uncharacterized protein n=1 Tax=Anguilla anguilla TaxID=7936 RepID=A0A0E9SXZ7_ANGAN
MPLALINLQYVWAEWTFTQTLRSIGLSSTWLLLFYHRGTLTD